MLGRLEEEESRRVILHLVPGCPRCQEITSELWWAAAGRGAGAAEAVDYGPCVRRVFDRVRRVQAGLEAERARSVEAHRRLGLLPTFWRCSPARAPR